MADDKRQGERAPVGVRVRLRFADLAAFVEGYAANVARTAVFLEGAAARPEGEVVRFEVVLADGQVALRGEGRVLAVARPDDAPGGIAVRYTRLDARSKALVDDLAARGAIRAAFEPPARVPAGPARASRPTLDDLDAELARLSEASPLRGSTPGSRASTPGGRRSLTDIDAEISALREDLARLSSAPAGPARAPTPVVASAPAASPPRVASIGATPPANGPAMPSLPPSPSDYADLPPVLSLLGEDGELRSAVVPPAPPPEEPRGDDHPTDRPPDASLSMREPTPVPDHDASDAAAAEAVAAASASIPQAPLLPGRDVTAPVFEPTGALTELPDLELDDELEPEAPKASRPRAR